MFKDNEAPTSPANKDLPLLKPVESIELLFSAIEETDERVEFEENQMVYFFEDSKQHYVYFIQEGEFSILRDHDGIRVVSSKAPMLLGLSVMLRGKRHSNYAIIAETKCRGYRVSCSEMKKRVTRLGLWAEVANIMAHALQVFMRRDKYLVGVDAYTTIKYMLMKISHLPLEERMHVNVEKFIHRNSGLSRSGIMKILSDLRVGGYIVIHRGHLVKINRLPEYY